MAIEKKFDLDQYNDLLWGKNETPPAPALSGAGGGSGGQRPVRLVVLADRSFSMFPHRHLMRQGLRQFFEILDPRVNYLITLLQFDSVADVLATAEPIASLVARAAVDAYQPRGATALWDAVLQALRLESSREDPTLLLVASDGEDTSSRTTAAEIRRLLEERLRWGNWSMLWLNMSGTPNPAALQAGMESVDFAREDVVRVLGEMAGRLARAVERMRLSGQCRIPSLLKEAK